MYPMPPLKPLLPPALLLLVIAAIAAQDAAEAPVLPAVTLEGSNKNTTYTFLYRDARPGDVPQREHDGLWEIQKEVIDNFIFDLAVFNRNTRTPYSKAPSKADFYRIGKGISGDYANFFLVLAREKGLAENLYKISGKRGKDTHVWLEYRTKENAYIIDPTWSDDHPLPALLRTSFKKTPAYGKRAFFTTYEEDKAIFQGHQELNHSSYPVRQTEIWLE
jgi:hypothetical protein